MGINPQVMADRLRSYAQAIADDQNVTLESVLEAMRSALADIHHLQCRSRIDPQDVTNA